MGDRIMTSISQLFAEKLRLDGVAYQYQPAMVLIKKDREKIEYTWFDYKEKVLQIMEGLKARNVKKGDFVAIIALNLPESFFAILGTILMGAVPVPINVMLLKEPEQKELNKILDDCRPALVLGNGCLKKLLPEHCITIDYIISKGAEIIGNRRVGLPISERGGQDLLIMPYTSGTTGQPKGVMLSSAGVIDRVAAVTNELRATRQEKVLSYLPLGHISELVATFFGQVEKGYTIYFTEHVEELVHDREKFRKVFPEILQQTQPTIFLAVPKVWINFRKEIESRLKRIPLFITKFEQIKNLLIKVIKRQLGFQKTRVFISAGSPIDQGEIDFFQSIDIKIEDIYGQTETGGPILINGSRIGAVKVMIMTQPEKEEILVQGLCLMLGYYNNPEATAQVIEDINKNGKLTYHTGDAGAWGKVFSPSQGFTQITYAGRLDDGFKLANGEFVSASKLYELENEIKKIEGVEEAIICGEGKPFLVALIFISESCERPWFINETKFQCLDKIGEGLYKIKKYKLLPKKELELTPTMKVKRKAVIKKFQNLIDMMTHGK